MKKSQEIDGDRSTAYVAAYDTGNLHLMKPYPNLSYKFKNKIYFE